MHKPYENCNFAGKTISVWDFSGEELLQLCRVEICLQIAKPM